LSPGSDGLGEFDYAGRAPNGSTAIGATDWGLNAQNLPARHSGKANYLLGDGHVKALLATNVSAGNDARDNSGYHCVCPTCAENTFGGNAAGTQGGTTQTGNVPAATFSIY